MKIQTQRWIDRWPGQLLCRVVSVWAWCVSLGRPQAQLAREPRHILIILLSEMGSVVLAGPMFAQIRRIVEPLEHLTRATRKLAGHWRNRCLRLSLRSRPRGKPRLRNLCWLTKMNPRLLNRTRLLSATCRPWPTPSS